MRKLLRGGIRTAAAFLATGGVVAAGLIAVAATPANAAPAQQARLAAADGAESDLYGASVAVDGNTAVVGALGAAGAGGEDQGAVYVLVRNGTSWTQQAKLVASDGQAGDHFGTSVAISGSTVVIGAEAGDGAAADEGAAYVFVRTGTAWSQQAKVTASDGASFDAFGQSVALSGDSAIVGAPSGNGAYVYVRSGTAWSQQAKLTAAGASGFGQSVALSGDTALVGALDPGAAHVFVRTGTTWASQAVLTATGGAPSDLFGLSVSLSGDSAAVGAPADDGVDGDGDAQGAVYVFTRTGSTWSQQAKLMASDASDGAFLGWSVALAGDTVLAGARGATIGANFEQGAAYLFGRTGTAWTQKNKLTASDGTEDDNFGVAVGLSGPTGIVGAPFAAGPGSTEQGAAHVFAETSVVTLRYYLHGNDIPGTAGGFTMNANQPPSQVLGLNLLNAPRWYGDPPTRGTFGTGSTFTFRMPCLLGLSLATTYQVATTAPDGGNAQVIGQVTRPVELCIGTRTVTIPVSTPRRVDGERLRLQISTAASLNLNLNIGSGTYLQATNFTPDL